jgi:hypothetical protein
MSIIDRTRAHLTSLGEKLMEKRTMLGLCLGVSMALSFVSAQADDSAKGEAKGHAMQIKVDKKTGKKIGRDDDTAEVDKVSAADSTVDSLTASGIMPLESSDVRHHADGSVSAQLGLRHMKFVTMSIDENGNREVEHQTLESFEATRKESTADEGEK